MPPTRARAAQAKANLFRTVMKHLVLRSDKTRAMARRHPWVYAGAIQRIVGGTPAAGETVAVVDGTGRFWAWAAYSPESALRARVWSWHESDRIDADWMHARISQALALRATLRRHGNAQRLVNGEADDLPGFICDRYDDTLVIQCLSTGAEQWRETLATALLAQTGAQRLVERSDASVRQREGLSPRVQAWQGDWPATPIPILEDGLHLSVDVRHGHKTGFYLDQRDNRLRLAQVVAQCAAAGGPAPRVLNAFSYTGGFTLAALRAGAAEVVSVDSSGPALAMAAAHVHHNGIAPETAPMVEADVFAYLKTAVAERSWFDIVVLDPPKFAPSMGHLDRAARAYKELNLKALALLRPGGWLFTFSCSGAMSVDLFQKVVAGAVFDAQCDASFIARLGAADDHPWRVTHPEGEYLKGWLLRRS